MPLPPIVTAHLFAPLDRALIELLKSLSPDEWETRTIVPQWNVRQVTAHLLDTAIRRLSLARDQHRVQVPGVISDGDLATFINKMNADGVALFGRLSSRVLVSLVEHTAPQLAEYFESLDPMAPAAFPVSWAGESNSLNWFDIARELTERWHHQQQIRLAVSRPGAMTPDFYRPVLETFMRALPYAYRGAYAPKGSVVRVVISGDCGGQWHLRRVSTGWALDDTPPASAVISTATIPQDIAWRIFTKGIRADEFSPFVVLDGNVALARVVLSLKGIVG